MQYRRLGKTELRVSEIGLGGDWLERHNAEEVISKAAYDPAADLKNSPDSVFCAAGAGFTVKWHEVAAYMKQHSGSVREKMPAKKPASPRDEEEELRLIFERTYGSVPSTSLLPRRDKPKAVVEPEKRERGEEFLLVDGYNVIFAWDSLRAVAEESIDSAREALIRMLINYNGARPTNLILVFDS